MTIILDVAMQGDVALERAIERLGAKAPLAIEQGMFVWGEEVMGTAKELVPVDTGQLRASGFVLTDSLADVGPEAQPSPQALALRENAGATIRGVLGFGGPATPYALAVHENPRSGKTQGLSPSGKKYKTWARVGEWKYLESAVKRHATELATRIAEAVKRSLGLGPA